MIGRIKGYLTGVKKEMGKVSWPTWDELKGATYIVLTLSILVAAFLFVVDLVLNKLMNFIL